MGGTIALTVRDKAGKLHKMARWTNTMSNFIGSMGLINEDAKHLQDYLKVFQGMREDYLKHKEDKKFEFEMSDCYGDHVYLAPTGYGLVVVDYQTHQILTRQGYTRFYEQALASFQLTYNDDQISDPEEHQRFKDLANAGRLTVEGRRPLDKSKSSKPVRIKDYTELKQIADNRNLCLGTISLDLAPWKIKRFEETPAGLKQLKKAVLGLGLKLTKTEEQLWKKYSHENADDEN